MWLARLIEAIDDFIINVFHDPLAQNPSELPMNAPDFPAISPVAQNPTIPAMPASKYMWDTPLGARHSIRVICDEEGLTLQQKNDLSATVHCESNYNPKCVHPNIVAGKVTSTDYGICQINDYWHIGSGKDFESANFVLSNPEACVRWMCRQWKAGNARAWVCYSKSLYTHYSA